MLLSESETLEPADFETLHTMKAAEAGPNAVPSADILLPAEGLKLDDVERRLVELALERTRGNQTRAAALLGLHRDQIRYRMEKYGLLKPLEP